MDSRPSFPPPEIEHLAEVLGLQIAWDLLDPVRGPDGDWDLDRTATESARIAAMEHEWALTDQANAGSEGYYPRSMGYGARLAFGAAMSGAAWAQLDRAERKKEAAARLRRVLEALRIRDSGSE
ncbi:MAG: hypothetical protein ABIO70_27465 [Pseudomonadota bacterium]